MSNNMDDVFIIPPRANNGKYKITVYYNYFSRKDKDKLTSESIYTWETDNEDIIKYFEARRTKVFYSQLRALVRFYGTKKVERYY